MSRSVIHLLHGTDSLSKVQDIASLHHIELKPLSKLALEVIAESKIHDIFLEQLEPLEKQGDIGIFYHTSHPKAQSGIFKSHLRRQIHSKTTMPLVPHISPFLSGPYGNTAKALGQYYQFPTQNGTAPSIAIISLGGTYLTHDLTYYWKNVLKLPNLPTVTSVGVGGAPNKADQPIIEGDGTDENTLDLEICGGLCPGSKLVVYFGRNTTRGFYDAISAAIHDTVHAPKVISISWGSSESNYIASQLDSYDQLFALAAQKGIVITVASGDNGSSDGQSDGRVHCDFPASSPHVVACGGTKILSVGETTWSWNPSTQSGTGGGLSSHFAKPDYQLTVPGCRTFNKRALPDIALNADPAFGWTIYYQGQLEKNAFGGTSCVAPAMAALFGLLNIVPLRGHLNALYSISSRPGCYRDVLTGSNGAYSAKPGFDLCTGLGSFNGVVLATYLNALPKTSSK